MPEYSDAARRCSDIVRQQIHNRNAGKWLAIRLSDGGYDGVVYDTRADAIRHQLHETQCAYIKVPWDSMSPRAAESFLATNRTLYDAGCRLSDPDHEIIAPDTREGLRAALRSLR